MRIGDRLAHLQIVERRRLHVHADVLDAVAVRRRDDRELADVLELGEILVRQIVGDVGVAALEQCAPVAGGRHHAPDDALHLGQRAARPLVVALVDHLGAGRSTSRPCRRRCRRCSAWYIRGPTGPSRSRSRGQGPLPPPGGPVPGPDHSPRNNRGDTGHPLQRPRGPGPVQTEHQRHPPRRGPAVITSHPGIVAQAARACQDPGLPLPRRCRPAGAARRRCSGPAASALAPRRSSAQPGSPGRAAGPVHRPSPVRKYPAPGLKLEPW